MDGKELAEKARALLPGLKVLYMSGYAENAVVHHGRRDADARLILKPFRSEDFALKVRRSLDEAT